MSAAAPEEERIRRLALENAVEHDGRPRPGPVLARLLATDPSLRGRSNELGRRVAAICTAVAALDPAQQASELAALGGPEPSGRPGAASETGELPPLPGAVDREVVLRLAPFPSGALHIGNARMLFINDEYRRRYHGRLFLVFDDTIGSEEKRVDPEIFDVIRQDLDRAEIRVDATYYKSDRVDRFYPWARRVIEARGAYVCRCPVDLLRSNRAEGVACPERGQSTEETMEGWEAMLAGRFREGEAVLRLRTDLRDPDPAFRDRVLFRISELEHPRVGHRYRVWPLLEFSWAVDDVELGLTHVLRGKDLVMEDRMEQFIWNLLGIRGPTFLHWGMLRVREAKISKSKSYAEVKSGVYDGWSDPRTWSLLSLERRGIGLSALRRFTLSFGLSLADVEVPAETLYAENRQAIDPTTERRMYIPDPVAVDVAGYPTELDSVALANHPDVPALGTRAVPAGPQLWLPRSEIERHAGEEIRLKDLLNIRLPSALPPDATAILPAEFTSRPNRRLPRIQWVSRPASVEVDLLRVDGTHERGRAEPALAAAGPGQALQFERVGFVRVEADWTRGVTPVRVCYGHP